MELRVEGMTWRSACPLRVVAALEGVDGVKSASADFVSQSASVRAKGKTCEPEGEELLIQALRNIGYDGEVLEVK